MPQEVDQVEAEVNEKLSNAEEELSSEEAAEQAVSSLDKEVDEEYQMAVKHGLIKEEKQEEKDPDEDSDKEDKEDDGKKDQEEEITHSTDLDSTFDKMSEDPQTEHETLTKFSKDQKAFYWKWKNDKKAKQEAVAQKELLEVQLKSMQEQIEALKKNPADIDSILSKEEEEQKKKEPVTREEYERDRLKAEKAAEYQQFITKKLSSQEAEARNKYEDFDEAVSQAPEILKKNPLYYDMYVQHVKDPKSDAAEFIYRVCKLHITPKAKKVDAVPEKTKRQTSASLPSAPASRVKKVGYEDMELADAARLSTTEWLKLPREVRERFLKM